MMDRLLITGATGLLGRNAIAHLRERYEVHAVSQDEREGDDSGVVWHRCDLLSQSERRTLVEDVGASHLVHLAWVTDPGVYWESPDNLTWVGATLELVSDFARAGGVRAVLTGTCAEYDWSLPGPYTEQSPTAPETLYGLAKLATGQLAMKFATALPLSLAWARPFYLYGPGESPVRMVPTFITRALAGMDPGPKTPGDIIDLMHVRDAGRAIAELVVSDVEGPVNVCTGSGVSIGSVARAVADLVGIASPPLHESAATKVVIGDNSRLRDEVGFSVPGDLHSGLDEAIEFWRLSEEGGTAR